METTGRSRLTQVSLDKDRSHQQCARSARAHPPLYRPSPTAGASPPLPGHALIAATAQCCPLLLLLISLLCTHPAAGFSSAPAGSSVLARYSDDARLDQKISLTTWAEPLEDVLARLSRETGTSFAFLGRDVGDQRVTVVLKDQPLRRLQELLAETLGLSWMRE